MTKTKQQSNGKVTENTTGNHTGNKDVDYTAEQEPVITYSTRTKSGNNPRWLKIGRVKRKKEEDNSSWLKFGNEFKIEDNSSWLKSGNSEVCFGAGDKTSDPVVRICDGQKRSDILAQANKIFKHVMEGADHTEIARRADSAAGAFEMAALNAISTGRSVPETFSAVSEAFSAVGAGAAKAKSPALISQEFMATLRGLLMPSRSEQVASAAL